MNNSVNVLIKIKESYNTFTETDIKLADYILANTQSVVMLSAKELGDNSHTSAAAVMRFIKKINYDSFLSFKLNLDKSINIQSYKKDDYIFKKNDSLFEITNKLKNKIYSVINTTADLINIEQLNIISDKICSASTIYLFGLGASATVASDFQEKLIKLNRSCIFHRDSHVQLSYSINTTKKDVAIIFSYSGTTKEMLAAAKKIKENSAYLIIVTGNIGSALAKYADNICHLPEIETEITKFRLGAIESRFSMFYFADIFFIIIARKQYEDLERLLKENRNLIGSI